MLIELFGCEYSQMFEILKNCISFLSSVQNSERGKKIGNVMVTTSRNVVQTGKAVGQSVGGAFSSAKTAMSSWLSTFTTSTPQSLPEPPNGKP